MLFEAFVAQLLANGHPKTETPRGSCADGMVLVQGAHVDQVQRLCIDWREGHCWGVLPGAIARERQTTNVAVCMDKFEWPNRAGAPPAVMDRFVEAEAKCQSVGKRLCSEAEWELACEGPQERLYPYGDAYDKTACNTDKPYKPVSEAKLASSNAAIWQREAKRVWQGEPSGSFPKCESPYGVMDMTGNVEEWVTTTRPEWQFRSSLKGGYWAKPWVGCRGTNDSHGPNFRFYEVGFRCCQDPK